MYTYEVSVEGNNDTIAPFVRKITKRVTLGVNMFFTLQISRLYYRGFACVLPDGS